jgi:hypothetical protein
MRRISIISPKRGNRTINSSASTFGELLNESGFAEEGFSFKTQAISISSTSGNEDIESNNFELPSGDFRLIISEKNNKAGA